MILRRLTPEIIEKVLAGPCDLRLKSADEARLLLNELSRHADLVDSGREPEALWHLTSVRQMMLPELRGTR